MYKDAYETIYFMLVLSIFSIIFLRLVPVRLCRNTVQLH